MSHLPVQAKLYVDWEDDGDFTGPNEDCSADLRGATVSRGRSGVTDEFGAGTMQVTLLNTSGLYSPFNGSSALFGSVVPGRQVKLELVHNSITYPIFRGRIEAIEEVRELDSEGRPYVRLSCADAFARLSRGKISVALAGPTSISSMLSIIRAAIASSVPVSLVNFVGGLYPFITNLTYFGFSDLPPLDALRLCTRQDPGSQLFCVNDGKVTYKNRFDRSAQPLSATLTEPEAFNFGIRESDFIDQIEVSYSGLHEDTAESDIFTLPSTITRALEPGSSAPGNTIKMEFAELAKDIVEPAQYTDYNCNTEADGSGIDVTNFVTVVSWTAYAQSGIANFNSGYPDTVYFVGDPKLRVRGVAVRRSPEARSITLTNSSSPVADQARREGFEFQDDLDLLDGYAAMRLGQLSTNQPRPTVIVPADSDANAVIVFGLDLGKRIHVTKTSSIYAPQIDADFFVENINLTIPDNGIVVATLGLAHEDIAGGNRFRISGASGGGADYSLIGSGDRIS